MSWPDAIIRYKDGTTRALSRATLAANWTDMPIHNIDRIDINPAFFASDPGSAVVMSGGDAYWGYAEGANSFVLGIHHPPIWGPYEPPHPPEVEESWYEFVFDKRTGRARSEREVTSIPAQALVRYAD